MSGGRAMLIMLERELRAEFRTRELLNTTIVFALIVVILFSFAFEPVSSEARRLGPGLLWIACLFAGSLMLNPTFAREQVNDTLSALRMAPVSGFAILAAKMIANFIFLSLAELILVPIFDVLYNVPLSAVTGRLALVMALGTAGLVITGTVFAALSARARMRELLLPLLLLPILAPLLIAAVGATASLFAEEPSLDRTWFTFLAGFDIVFLTASWLLADYLLEE
jgi:heme exporter protein B